MDCDGDLNLRLYFEEKSWKVWTIKHDSVSCFMWAPCGDHFSELVNVIAVKLFMKLVIDVILAFPSNLLKSC